MAVFVKVCGLTRPEDAELAIAAGADALGFVHEPTSPRCIAPEDVDWISGLAGALKVAVFGAAIPWLAPETFDRVQGLSSLDWPDPASFFQVLRLRQGDAAASLLAGPIRGTAIVLDAHSEGAYGGTGRRTDWDLAAEIVELADRPVILAGGLTPDNVADAIRVVGPFGVDASSGLEASPGVKDPAKLRDFIRTAKSQS